MAMAEASQRRGAAKLSGNDPGVCRKTAEFLNEADRHLLIAAGALKELTRGAPIQDLRRARLAS